MYLFEKVVDKSFICFKEASENMESKQGFLCSGFDIKRAEDFWVLLAACGVTNTKQKGLRAFLVGNETEW